jgi:hypothetical protein
VREISAGGREDIVVGLLADFIVATPEDALQYESRVHNGEPIPPDRYQRAEYKNFMPLSVEMLWALLRREHWDARHHRLEHVYHAEGGESLLERFPDELVHRLSALNETDQSQVADAWARNKEVPGSSEELRPVLRDLHHLAFQALTTGMGLYLWCSL